MDLGDIARGAGGVQEGPGPADAQLGLANGDRSRTALPGQVLEVVEDGLLVAVLELGRPDLRLAGPEPGLGQRDLIAEPGADLLDVLLRAGGLGAAA